MNRRDILSRLFFVPLAVTYQSKGINERWYFDGGPPQCRECLAIQELRAEFVQHHPAKIAMKEWHHPTCSRRSRNGETSRYE